MSSTLSWMPKIEPSKDLSYDLKCIFRKLYGEPVNEVLDAHDYPKLEGIIAGSENAVVVNEIKVLMNAIHEYDRIQVKEVY